MNVRPISPHAVARPLLQCAAVLCVTALCASAWAQRVAVMDMEGQGLDATTTSTLTSIVRNEAQQTMSSLVVSKSSVNLSESVVLLGCDSRSIRCLNRLADQLKVQRLIIPRLDKEGPKKYRLKIDLFDKKKDAITDRLQKVIENDDILASVRQETQLFFQDIVTKANAATLQVSSNVRGAQVLVDGKVIGQTPLLRKGIPPGSHTVEVLSEGFTSWKANVQMQAKGRTQFNVDLKPLPKPVAQAQPVAQPSVVQSPKLGRRDTQVVVPKTTTDTNWAALSLVSLGGVALGGSLVSGVLMGQVEDDLRQQGRSLTQAQYEEKIEEGERYELIHRVSLGVGLVAGSIGGLWWVFGGESNETVTLHVYPTTQGVATTLRW